MSRKPRLRTMAPRVATLAPRIKPLKGTPRLSDTSGHRWAKLREQVLREEPLCRPCRARNLVTPSAECDHILPLAQGGTDERENLQGICRECHRDKSAREQGYTTKPEIGLDGYPVDKERK